MISMRLRTLIPLNRPNRPPQRAETNELILIFYVTRHLSPTHIFKLLYFHIFPTVRYHWLSCLDYIGQTDQFDWQSSVFSFSSKYSQKLTLVIFCKVYFSCFLVVLLLNYISDSEYLKFWCSHVDYSNWLPFYIQMFIDWLLAFMNIHWD